MRIAFFTDMFLPQVNGVASLVANTAKALNQAGHEVIIFVPNLKRISRKKFEAENVKIVYLPTLPGEFYPEFKLSFMGFPRVMRHLYKFKPDIIHFHSPFSTGFDAISAAKILHKPLVGTIHYYFANNNYLEWVNNSIVHKIALGLGELWFKYSCYFYSKCDLRLSPSKTLISELKKLGYKKTIHHLPNGVFLVDKTVGREKIKSKLRAKYGLKEKIIIHSGRLSAEKKIDIVIRSFVLVVKDFPESSLLIIGDGPARKDLEKLVRAMKIEKNVVFTGFIAHEELIESQMLSGGDMFVTASAMENQPMSVLEAMAAGLPILAVKEAGMIELVSDNGFLVNGNDFKSLALAIGKLLSNRELTEKLSVNSRKRAEAYSINKTVDSLVKMYETLLVKKKNQKITKSENFYSPKNIINEIEKWLTL